MDVGGRAKQEARADAYMDVGGRAKHDSREGGGRAKQDARAEEARADAYMDVGGTRPWMVEGRTMQELLSRVTQGVGTERLPGTRRLQRGKSSLIITPF
jgi:hypothetical protein